MDMAPARGGRNTDRRFLRETVANVGRLQPRAVAMQKGPANDCASQPLQ
jgi:hypothetical protein